MCTIAIEGITSLDQTPCTNMYKNNARFRLFWRIGKRSIEVVSFFFENSKNFEENLKLSLFLNFLKKHEIILKNIIIHGCIQYGINQKFVTLLVYI